MASPPRIPPRNEAGRPGPAEPRPGLARARQTLLRARSARLVAASEGLLREAFERADVVSEGERGADGSYFGSTSLVLRGALTGFSGLPRSVFEADPHLRLRALRVARREAERRAGAALGTVRADLSVSVTRRTARHEPLAAAPPSGYEVEIRVDVAAPVAPGGRRASEVR